MNIQELYQKIDQWGRDRGLLPENGATLRAQLSKLQSELNETIEGAEANQFDLIVDGLGDMFVVLVQAARCAGVDLEYAIEVAYNEIKDRKGQMKCGIFVKEADLKFILGTSWEPIFNNCKTADQVHAVIDGSQGKVI